MHEDRWEHRRERWERRWERRRARWHSPSKHLFSGVLFVLIGLIFLLGNMGFLNVDAILRFWPLILIALGVFRIVECRDDFARSSGIFWVVIGSFLLLGTLGILRVALHSMWPVFLIGLGALMLWRSFLVKRAGGDFGERAQGEAKTDASQAADSSASSSNSIFSATAILGGIERRINSQDFRGGEAKAILGGCEIDLRGASITPPHEPVINVFALFGGIEIRIPEDWTVISEVEAILGGYDDKKTDSPKQESKRVYIRGSVMMGGIEVRN
jgi:predicted membrane protein